MKLAILTQGKESHSRLLGADIPDGINLSLDRPYGQDGDNLFASVFSEYGDSLKLARKMADFRDDIFDEKCCHLLIDDPSQRFCEHLYARFGRFERTLRSVLRLALCTEKGNFKNPLIKELESKTLDQIHSGWLCSTSFQTAVQNMTSGNNKHFSKEQLERLITATDNDTAWNRAFSTDQMKTVRKRFSDIKNRRNDVMHFHRISYRRYAETLKLIERANKELEQCSNMLLCDDMLSLGSSGFTESIISMLDDIYTQMDYYEHLAEAATELSNLIKPPSDFHDTVNNVAGTISTSAYSRLLAESTIENNPGILTAISRLSSSLPEFNQKETDTKQE